MQLVRAAESSPDIPRYERPGVERLPMVFESEEYDILVEAVVTGLSRPWGMVFLPDGDMLITERQGTVRLIRDGTLEPEPVPGTPEVLARQRRIAESRFTGCVSVALHHLGARGNGQQRVGYLSLSGGRDSPDRKIQRRAGPEQALSDSRWSQRS